MKKVKIINYNINITGSNVEGKDVTLDAKENLNITASKTTNKLEQDSKSSSSSVGVGFDIATGQVSSVNISGSKSNGEVDANSTSYNESTVKADKKLDFTSAKDTNIKGGNLSGEKVTGNVGGDLNIESKQDKNSYEEKNSSAGFGIGMPFSNKDSANKIGIFGSAGKSDVDSKYKSVTDQSGIYAGKEGFDINVGENTDLKGGIISSEAEKGKNKISTGTLTYEDIKNKADYKAGGAGINVDTSPGAEHKDAGATPNIGVGAKDDAESTTKATVSEGEIEIRDKENQKQDLAGLNRDTKNSLNKLGEIFDKTKVEERQELAGLFGEIAYKAVGYLAIKNGWQEGSAEKNALHALVGGIMSELTDSGFLAGASGAMINEMIQDKLSDMFKDNPAMHQWASALIGGVVSQVVAYNAQAGAGTASSGTKNNYLTHKQWNDYQRELAACNGDPEKEQAVRNKYKLISDAQTEAGNLGEKEGEGYEWGVDLDESGNFKGFVISENSSAFANARNNEIVNMLCNEIDKSDWQPNELKMYTLVAKAGNKYIKANAEVGYAVDAKNNVYRVYLGGVSSETGLNIEFSKLIDALSVFSVNYDSFNVPGKELSKEKLKEKYSGSSFSVNKTVLGLNIGVSGNGNMSTGNIGYNNEVNSMGIAYIYMEPIN